MQTEADLPPVTDLPVEECSTVTRVALVEEKPQTNTMTVKEEAEAEDAEEQQVLCDSPVLPPAEASTAGGGSVEQVPDEFRYSI
jgi:hypothetical protein